MSAALTQPPNYYYVCSYARPEWGTSILFSKIDLDGKEIVFSKEVPITGQICFIAPPIIEREEERFFFLSTIYGLPGHNTPAGNPYGFFAVASEHGDIIQIDSIPNTQFLRPVDTLRNAVEFIDSLGGTNIAALSVDHSNKLVINIIGKNTYEDQNYPIIGGFHYFQRIDKSNRIAHWNVTEAGPYLLLIDEENKCLLDSLNISTPEGYSYLLALSADGSTVYSFYFDCFCKGWRYPSELASIAPSYLKRFSTEDLSLVDSTNIPSPCQDSVCLDHSWATCDRVGDYLVYFFMGTAHIEWFVPAMLFIFDTRTNEATWLRVGWR
jgi:hypothetical protein